MDANGFRWWRSALETPGRLRAIAAFILDTYPEEFALHRNMAGSLSTTST
jgi:hypothetical protein